MGGLAAHGDAIPQSSSPQIHILIIILIMISVNDSLNKLQPKAENIMTYSLEKNMERLMALIILFTRHTIILIIIIMLMILTING